MVVKDMVPPKMKPWQMETTLRPRPFLAGGLGLLHSGLIKAQGYQGPWVERMPCYVTDSSRLMVSGIKIHDKAGNTFHSFPLGVWSTFSALFLWFEGLVTSKEHLDGCLDLSNPGPRCQPCGPFGFPKF